MNNLQSKLPSGWHWVKLGEVCEIIMGQSPPGYTYNKERKGLPFFQGKIDFGEIFPTVSTWCTEPKKTAEPNDILISVRAPVGPTNLCNMKCCIGRGLTAIRSKDNTDTWFIFYFLRLIEKRILSVGSGSTFSAISKSQIYNLKIPLPLLPEQKRIAKKVKEMMQDVDNARSACEKQLEATKSLPSSYLRQVFESKEAKKWERKNFKECIIKRDGLGVEGIQQKGYQRTGDYPIIDQGHNLICGYTNDSTKLYQGELPVIIFGDHTRIFKYVDFPFAIGADGTKIVLSDQKIIMPQFFYFALLNLKIRNLGYSRHYKILKDMSIPFPSLPVQQRIAFELKEKMEGVEKLRTSIEKQLETINVLPQAILRKAFRGEL